MSEPSPPDPNFPRLTERAFPAYRYAPGRRPHPVNDPDGHSHGRVLPDFGEEALVACANWRASPHFCHSVDLYNYAYWWEAHEGWEGLWRALDTDTPHRYALQAFIQVSAAHLQRFLEHPKGGDDAATPCANPPGYVPPGGRDRVRHTHRSLVV